MTGFLLDTNVLSETIRSNPEQRVVDWLVDQQDDSLFLSVLTIGELEKGIASVKDSKRKATLRRWLDDEIKVIFAGRILPIDQKTSTTWGKTLAAAGRPLPAIDSLLAATALQHGLTFVTRNTKDVSSTGVECLNPWER
ncbi:MAG TPA: type II toxin-antitoxin system VapC family toxin [Roseimicrobium sp.]|nr:type II toxin-antitoxin system VapC family toxin [Roseimicrobium sp.]